MPLIVDEVVISVEVTTGGAKRAGASDESLTLDRQAIVEDCVERVLDILRQREEP